MDDSRGGRNIWRVNVWKMEDFILHSIASYLMGTFFSSLVYRGGLCDYVSESFRFCCCYFSFSSLVAHQWWCARNSPMMVHSEKTSNSYNHHNSNSWKEWGPHRWLLGRSLPSSRGGGKKRWERKQNRKFKRRRKKNQETHNQKNKWPRRGSIHLSGVNDEATWWITLVVKVKKEEEEVYRKKVALSLVSPCLAVSTSAAATFMKYHSSFWLWFYTHSLCSSLGSPASHSLPVALCITSAVLMCYMDGISQHQAKLRCVTSKVKHKYPLVPIRCSVPSWFEWILYIYYML